MSSITTSTAETITAQRTVNRSPKLDNVEMTAKDRPKTVWGEDPEAWLCASVTPHIEPGKGPMLLIYADGDADWRRGQNDTFGEALRAAGNREVRVVEVTDRDHSTLPTQMNTGNDQIGGLVLRFIRRERECCTGVSPRRGDRVHAAEPDELGIDGI